MFRDFARSITVVVLIVLSSSCPAYYRVHTSISELYFKDIAQIFYHAYKSDPYCYPFLEQDYFEYLLDMQNTTALTLHTVTADDMIVGAILGYPLGTYLTEGFSEKTYAILKKHCKNTDKFYYLAELVLLPAYQKKGLSKFLLHSFYESVQALGYTHIIAAVIDNKKDNQLNNYYQHMGFVKTPYCFDLTWETVIGSIMKDQTHTICLWEKALHYEVN